MTGNLCLANTQRNMVKFDIILIPGYLILRVVPAAPKGLGSQETSEPKRDPEWTLPIGHLQQPSLSTCFRHPAFCLLSLLRVKLMVSEHKMGSHRLEGVNEVLCPAHLLMTLPWKLVETYAF